MSNDPTRFAISLDEQKVAIRSYRGDSWFIANFNEVQGQHMGEVPDDWTYYVPARPRDVAVETLEQLVNQTEATLWELGSIRRLLEVEEGT